MELLTTLDQLPEACRGGVALCIGMFDGLHRGHQLLIETTRRQAERLGLRSLVFTFTEHPLALLAPPYAPLLLMSVEDKIERIGAMGVDLCALIEFTPAFAAIPAREFLVSLVSGACQARFVTCGRDFHFGARGLGDAALLEDEGARLGFAVEVRDALNEGHGPIKSTRVRQALFDGNVAEAARLLGRPYTLEGLVVQGDRRGRQIGFPTANLESPPRRLVPGNGVYAVRATVEGRTWDAMTNIGLRPTFQGERRTIETFLFDFSGELYGRELRLAFIDFIRDEQRFASAEALAAQLERDREACRARLGGADS
jgi:riboflavin kinase/FMN adenylyltransferase